MFWKRKDCEGCQVHKENYIKLSGAFYDVCDKNRKLERENQQLRNELAARSFFKSEEKRVG